MLTVFLSVFGVVALLVADLTWGSAEMDDEGLGGGSCDVEGALSPLC
jgi:hypothetical protein